MQIAVCHLTRMRGGNVCVAGIDLRSGDHVRPEIRGQALGSKHLRREGGCFDIAGIVDLGTTTPIGRAPMHEDHEFDPSAARFIKTQDADAFWRLLARHKKLLLTDIFGDELTQRGRASFGTDLEHGIASLGFLAPFEPPQLYIQAREGRPSMVRIRFSDGVFSPDASVTDIRVYGSDYATPDADEIERLSDAIARSKQVLLGVGLTRPFDPTGGSRPVHWLQVNGIHFVEEPARTHA